MGDRECGTMGLRDEELGDGLGPPPTCARSNTAHACVGGGQGSGFKVSFGFRV